MNSPASPVRVLGIETSCDETGTAIHCSRDGLVAQALHSQIRLHADYGGVVPELASRDHVRRLIPLVREVLQAAKMSTADLSAIAFTEGPGLAGALLVGASVANGLGYALGRPVLGVHHLEAHLLSPLLSTPAPAFPFVALLVSGGHTQFMRVDGIGEYTLLGETQDDAAGEAFDKTAKLLGLGYPGGPALARLADEGRPGRFRLPRPMLASGDLEMSFSGLKTAVLTEARRRPLTETDRADLAAEFQEAIVDVLASKARAALEQEGLDQLVVAGGVGANRRLRARLADAAAAIGARIFHPPIDLCTDNGAMVAFAAGLRIGRFGLPAAAETGAFTVRPRWSLSTLGRDAD